MTIVLIFYLTMLVITEVLKINNKLLSIQKNGLCHWSMFQKGEHFRVDENEF